ncbi:reverse transcriptase domain-containing protein [Tanacetum coccineum]
MHTRASNYELVEPFAEPEQTLNRRLRRRNRRVPFERRDKRPEQTRIIYPPILKNHNLMDDEPMWATDRVVALTPSLAITILETANEFAIKENHLTLVKGNQFDGRIKTDPLKHIHEFLGICDMFKYKDTENEAVRLMMFPLSLTAFADEGSNNSDTDKIMARMDAMAIKMAAQYKEFQTRSKCNHCGEAKFNRLADKQSGRHSGSLPSNTQPNPKGSSSKPYQPPQARNEHANIGFTRSGRSYDPPTNPNDQPNDSENPVNFDSNDEDEEPTPQPKPKDPKSVQEKATPNSYKPKIPYPQRLQKEKIKAQYGKFLDMIRAVRINVPLVDVLAGMPNNGKFLKELVSNKYKLEQISSAFLSVEIDLGASINLMPYSLYTKLSLETLKPTKISVRLADRSFQYPIRIAENMLVEVGKFTFPVDFVIHEMEEDSKVPLIIDVIDEIVEEDFDALLDEGSKILYSIEGTPLKDEIFAEFDEFIAMNIKENSKPESDEEEPIFEKITFNTDYKIKTSLEEPPTDIELKPLPEHLEYAFLEEPSFIPVIISSQLPEQNKNKLISVLKNHNHAFA